MYEQLEQEALNAGMEAQLQLLKRVPPRGTFSPNWETRLVNVLQHPHKLLSGLLVFSQARQSPVSQQACVRERTWRQGEVLE